MRLRRSRPEPPMSPERAAALAALDETVVASTRALAEIDQRGVGGPAFDEFRKTQRRTLDALDDWVKAGMP